MAVIVRDYSTGELKHNVVALAKAAKLVAGLSRPEEFVVIAVTSRPRPGTL
jgi:hypothetical protein